MQLGLYRTTLAAARLSSEFKVSCLGKMAGRGMRSTHEENSVNSRINFTDKEQGQPESWNVSQVAHEQEFPPLSASNSSRQGKRRTRIDLGTPSEQKPEVVQNIGPLQLEASTSISDQNNTYLPTSFGKNYSSSSRDPKLRQIYHEHGERKRSSISLLDTSVDEPFDICSPETGESNTLRSPANWKKRGDCVPELQSAEEIDQNNDNLEKSSNIEDLVEENGQVLRPGMVLLKHYVPLSEQVDIVNRCRELGLGPGGFYRPGYNDGAKLRLYMMCLGLDWNPQTRSYGERRHHDNVAPPNIPHEFSSLVCRVLDYSHTLIKRDMKSINVEAILPAMSPDICIVNFYTTNGRLGLHQDRDESQESLLKGFPVVSISVGDSAEFLYGDQRDVAKAKRVLLESGDILIFGGESRHIFHGVKTIIPDTAPPALLKNTKLRPGRLNLTFRKY